MLDISVTADNIHGWHQHHQYHHQHHHQHHRYRRHHYIIIAIVNMIDISVTPNYTHGWHQHQDKSLFGREERVEQLQIYKYLWILPYATISTHVQQTKRPLQIYGDFNAPLKNTFHGR